MARNPDIFGEDVVELAMEALGAGATALINDKFMAPIAKNMLPGVFANETTGKLADAGTTGLTAYGVGEAVGMIDRKTGRQLKRGGVLLAIAKGISAFVPGFGLTANMPSSLSLVNPFSAPKVVEAPKSNGNGMASIPASTRALGVGSMGL